MTLAAWIFMLGSVSFVTVLMLLCFKRVLAEPREPAKQAKDFHSA